MTQNGDAKKLHLHSLVLPWRCQAPRSKVEEWSHKF